MISLELAAGYMVDIQHTTTNSPSGALRAPVTDQNNHDLYHGFLKYNALETLDKSRCSLQTWTRLKRLAQTWTDSIALYGLFGFDAAAISGPIRPLRIALVAGPNHIGMRLEENNFCSWASNVLRRSWSSQWCVRIRRPAPHNKFAGCMLYYTSDRNCEIVKIQRIESIGSTSILWT